MNNDLLAETQEAYDKGYDDGLSEKPRDITEQLEYEFKRGYVKGWAEGVDDFLKKIEEYEK